MVSSKSFLRNDPFTYTVFGEPLVLQDWLAQVTFSLLYSLGGFNALILFKALLVGASFLLGGKIALERGGHPLTVLLLSLLAVATIQPALVERPYIFSYFFLATTSFLLHRSRHTNSFSYLLPLPIIFGVWGNMHSGFIFGLALLVAYYGGIFTEKIFHRGHTLFFLQKKGVALFVACFATPMISPHGFMVYFFPFDMAKLYKTGALIATEYMFPSYRFFPSFWMMVALSCLCLIILKGKFGTIDFYTLLGFTVLGVMARRNLAPYMVAVVPFMAAHLRRVEEVVHWRHFRSIFRGTLVTAALFLAFFFIRNGSGSMQKIGGLGLKKHIYPVQIAKFIMDNNIDGHMFNDPYWGGYLSWALYPDRKIFVDSRGHICRSVMMDIQGRGQKVSWNSIVKKYGIDYALMQYSEEIYPGSPGGERTLPRRDWALVFWDDSGMVYLERTPKWEALIRQYEYAFVQPDQNIEYLDALIAQGRAPVIEQELQRKLNEDPACGRAWYLLGRLHSKQGNTELAANFLSKAIETDKSKVSDAKETLARLYLKDAAK